MMGGYSESVDKLLWTLQTKIILIDQGIPMHINEVYTSALSLSQEGIQIIDGHKNYQVTKGMCTLLNLSLG